MAGKQKGSSSRSLSSDNDPILRDSNISDKIDALSNKMDSKFEELDSKFSSLHNEFSSSNVRMQACETQGTALAADLNSAVKADAGLTDPLFKVNMANFHALTQRLTIERYNTIYYYDQPEKLLVFSPGFSPGEVSLSEHKITSFPNPCRSCSLYLRFSSSFPFLFYSADTENVGESYISTQGFTLQDS